MNRRGAVSSVSVPGLRCFLLLLAGVLSLLCACGACAQSGTPYTLHVNVRLLQVPTLVLGPAFQPMPGIAAKQFSIRLDHGPAFRPSEARPEGDDPITLAILLDLSGSESDLIKQFSLDFSPWIAGSFRPADRIALYGLDCKLVHTNGYLPADPVRLQRALDQVIHSPAVHGTKSGPACGRTLPLWDVLAFITQQSSGLSGRRIILALTSGYNGHSSVKISDVRDMAIDRSLTIFGLSQMTDFFEGPRIGEDLSSLCQLTGGLAMPASHDLPADLSRFVSMVRGRYILEFSEPSNVSPGGHRIDVTIDGARAFIRPAGVAAILDPSTANDPTVLPGDTANAPRMGKDRPRDR